MNIATFKAAVDDRKNFPEREFLLVIMVPMMQAKDWQDRQKRQEALGHLKKRRPSLYKKVAHAQKEIKNLAKHRNQSSFV